MHVVMVRAATAAHDTERRHLLREGAVVCGQGGRIPAIQLQRVVQLRVALARCVGAQPADPLYPRVAGGQHVGEVGLLRDHGGRELLARLESTVCPQSADAWALIATAQAALRWTAEDGDESRLRQQARTAAERALAIDPWCGEAHKALYLLQPPAGAFAAKEAALLRACEAAPTNGEIHWALVQLLLGLGRLDAAATHAELAHRVDPLRPPNVMAYALSLHSAGQAALALDLFEDAVARWPDDPSVLAIAAWAAATAGAMERVDRLLVHYQPDRYSTAARSTTSRAFLAIEAYRRPGSNACDRLVERFHQDVAEGRPRFSVMAACANLGADVDALYGAIPPASLQRLHRPDGTARPSRRPGAPLPAC